MMKNGWRKVTAAAAVLALMLCSGAIGALAFSGEKVVEVPVEHEMLTMDEIGLTLFFPDSWQGRYKVVKGTFEPYDSPCGRSV